MHAITKTLSALGTDSVDSEEDSDSDDESSGGSEGSCSYSDSNSDSDDESSGEEEEDTGSNSDCTSEHSEQTFSIQETNFESVCTCCISVESVTDVCKYSVQELIKPVILGSA